MKRKPIFFIKNIYREGPGRFSEILKNKGIPYNVVDLSQKLFLPRVEEYSGVILLGGPQSGNDNTRHINEVGAYVKEILYKKVPCLGICLGMQLLSKAAGAKITVCSTKEIGWKNGRNEVYTIIPSPDCKDDSLFDGLDFPAPIFHLHGETVTLPDTVRLLAYGNECHTQIVKVGNNAYGIQGHIELTGKMIRAWLKQDSDLKKLDRATVLRDWDNYYEKYRRFGEKLFINFLTLLKIV